MMTIAQLRDHGANVDEALKRCLNNETFYLGLVSKALQDPSFMGNLSLTPISKPVQEITELLRARTDTDYTPYLEEILARKNELKALL